MDHDNPIADWDQEESGIYLCPSVNPELGVALRLSYFTSPDEIQRDEPRGIQLLLTARTS